SAMTAVARFSPRASTTAVGRFASAAPSPLRAATAHASEITAIWGSPNLMGDRSHGPFIALSATTGVGSGGSGIEDGPIVGAAGGVISGSQPAAVAGALASQ